MLKRYGSSCPQEELVDFCRRKGIAVTAYSPLGSTNSPLLTNPTVVKVAEKHKVGPANVLISLQANRPGVNGKHLPDLVASILMMSATAVLTKSVTPSRIECKITFKEQR